MSATADAHGHATIDLAALRERLADGRPAWRSLDEAADTPEFRRWIETEFPALSRLIAERTDRRTLIKLMGASLAMGGLAACSKAEQIVPYVMQPENIVPGNPRHYATSLTSGGYGIGAVVESHEGRPTKVEGNPDHPASRGATDAVMQAAPLALFDPDRLRTPMRDGVPASAGAFEQEMAALAARLDETRGRGFAVLAEPSTSPTLAGQLADLRERYPDMRIHLHDTLAGTAGVQATTALFGRPLVPVYRFDRADVILSLDADFLGDGPGRLAYAADFAAGRRVRGPGDTMSRLYAVESTPTITGAAADHRRAVKPGEVSAVAAALEAHLGGGALPDAGPIAPEWMDALTADLAAAGPRALVVPGKAQSPFVFAMALALNARLGSLGHAVELIEPPLSIESDGDLAELCDQISGGGVDTLVCLGSNPVFTAPADLDVRGALARLDLFVHWSLYRDETAALADWLVPAAHELESWTDIRAFDGTASIVQPLIRPVYGGRTVHEVVAMLANEFATPARDLVARHWQDKLDGEAWQDALKRGMIPETAFDPVAVSPASGLGGLRRPDAGGQGIELRFTPDPYLLDGRYANLPWLQELPRPLTKLVWGNAALVSPATAERHGLANEQITRVSRGDRSLVAPVWIMPGHPDDTVTLTLGHGRRGAGQVADLSGGYDAGPIRTRDAPWIADGASITPLDERGRVLTTQHHQSMEGRDIVRGASLEAFRADPGVVHEGARPPPTESLYPPWDYEQEAWGMVIDQTACIGCMACVAACQAENNIATVGPEGCARGQEMHWLRVDRYYQGDLDQPDTQFQPVPCMHCEHAPCEVVCPVNATVHTHDGLNAQVYNRCVGTRYCSQNCPYKVRRFNFLEWQPFDTGEAGPEQAVRNPDVSVRSRGVMEKCTYCVQRISAARIAAQIDNRPITDGEVVTACQQACPTKAIVFGDLNDGGSRVAADKAAPHQYGLLEELNTRPRTSYLARVRNTNPRLGRAGTREDRGDG